MTLRNLWEERALPRLVDIALRDSVAQRFRQEVCTPVAGEVLEVGFGSGRNLPHYGESVCRVLAVEPSDLAWARSRSRALDFGRPVERIGLDGARLSAPDESVDAVVSTWTLCTIPDLDAALAEFRRVLRPGGVVHFVEHTVSPHPWLATVERAVQPAWGLVSGGCHVDRDIPALLTGAGYTLRMRRGGFVVGTAHPR